jgi:benzoyl-CoA reductase/2-hydroxyglutaryl-CoA dehydratase subunit BcrC/BadD/HgdB
MTWHRKANYHLWRSMGIPGLLKADEARRSLRRRVRGPRRPPPSWAGPPMACARELRRIMSTHYLLARHASGARPVAWVTSGAPVEILRALDFYTVYPENHGAVCGARKRGVDMSQPAEDVGFSPDICSYARIDLGLALGAQSPVGRLPRPDVLVCSTNICQTVLYWYKQLAHYYKVPLLLFDAPFVTDELTPASLAFMTHQLKALVEPLERISRREFSPDRFLDVLRRAQRTSLMWGEILGTLKTRPAPMSIFDAFVHMAPVVSLRGLPVAERYYEVLLAELRTRVSQGVGAITNERHRLLWDNIAVWFKLAEFARLFAERGAVFVAATYTNAWAETAHFLDESEPFESMARTYALVVLNRNLDHRFQLMSSMVAGYAIDGAVFHSTRSCKPYSMGQYDMKRRFLADLGVKSVIIEADTTDPRNYAHGPTVTRLEAFLESL